MTHSLPSLLRRQSVIRLVCGAAALVLFVPAALAKHKENAGPEDPPILFPVPTPEPLSVEDALKTFKLPAGLRIECVASEPLVDSPTVATFDEQGRLWVCEMRGYMHDVDQL